MCHQVIFYKMYISVVTECALRRCVRRLQLFFMVVFVATSGESIKSNRSKYASYEVREVSLIIIWLIATDARACTDVREFIFGIYTISTINVVIVQVTDVIFLRVFTFVGLFLLFFIHTDASKSPNSPIFLSFSFLRLYVCVDANAFLTFFWLVALFIVLSILTIFFLSVLLD